MMQLTTIRGVVEGGDEGADQHLHDGDKAGDDHDVAGDADLAGNDVFQGGDGHIGADEYQRCGHPHAQGTGDLGAGGQGGAGAQHQDQHWVFPDDSPGKNGKFPLHWAASFTSV